MRKQNSEFLTAFTSEATQDIKNTDCFGYVELDDFACYVMADGIEDQLEAISAKLAVDTVVTVFSETPSMSRRMMKKCLIAANKALLEAKSKTTLKASILIVLTDYVKLRYGQAGNIRLSLYRNGFIKEKTTDQSLAMNLVKSGEISQDKVAAHEERNNLYTYLGQAQEFRPYISHKIKLTNEDMIALYTRAIWENIDEGEIKDVFADASDKPQELVDTLEDLLMSRQPENLGKYTFAAIFINKVFIDPNKRKKRKKIIVLTVTAAVIILVLSIVMYVHFQQRQKKIADMKQSYTDTIEYIQMNNYMRAEETCKDAQSMANELKDGGMQKELGNYCKLIEAVLAAQEDLDNDKYKEAQDGFKEALVRSRYADNIGKDYISDKLSLTADYLSVYDCIALGDALASNLQYSEAEEKYLEAKEIATKIYFDKGRTEAVDALEKLYSDQKDQKEKEKEEQQDRINKEETAANYLAQGDSAFAQGDYNSAKVYYQSAWQKYKELKDKVQQKIVKDKISVTDQKIQERELKEKEAEDYVAQAVKCMDNKNYSGAKKYYLFARDIYAGMKDDEKVAEIERKIEIVEMNEEEQKESSSKGITAEIGGE